MKYYNLPRLDAAWTYFTLNIEIWWGYDRDTLSGANMRRWESHEPNGAFWETHRTQVGGFSDFPAGKPCLITLECMRMGQDLMIFDGCFTWSWYILMIGTADWWVIFSLATWQSVPIRFPNLSQNHEERVLRDPETWRRVLRDPVPLQIHATSFVFFWISATLSGAI